MSDWNHSNSSAGQEPAHNQWQVPPQYGNYYPPSTSAAAQSGPTYNQSPQQQPVPIHATYPNAYGTSNPYYDSQAGTALSQQPNAGYVHQQPSKPDPAAGRRSDGDGWDNSWNWSAGGWDSTGGGGNGTVEAQQPRQHVNSVNNAIQPDANMPPASAHQPTQYQYPHQYMDSYPAHTAANSYASNMYNPADPSSTGAPANYEYGGQPTVLNPVSSGQIVNTCDDRNLGSCSP